MTDSAFNRFHASGTSSARAAFTPTPPTPASGPGVAYIWTETDTGAVYFWNSSTESWVEITGSGGSGDPFFAAGVPALSSFGVVNSQSGFASSENSGKIINVSTPGSSGASLTLLTKAMPTPPFRLVASMSFAGKIANNIAVGLGFYNSTTGAVQYIGASYYNGFSGLVEHWNSPTSFSAGDATFGLNGGASSIIFGVGNDGTNISYGVSPDGANFYTAFETALSGSFVGSAVNDVCWVINTSNASAANGVSASLNLWDPAGLSRVALPR